MKTAKQILVDARELLSEPSRWTRGMYARNVDGDEEPPDSELAVCWCMLGALERASGDAFAGHVFASGARAALESAVGETDDEPIHDFNDDEATTHADVLAALDSAIEAAS